MKYTYNISGNKVICVSRYAGKPVRGIAKCCEEYDNFNAETGMKLARLRCDKKIALKRVDSTIHKLNSAIENLVKAQNDVDILTKLLSKHEESYESLSNSLTEFEQELDTVQQ